MGEKINNKINNKISNKANRMLYILAQLESGKRVSKEDFANYFEVDKRTIQRDIGALNQYLEEINPYRGVYIENNKEDNRYELLIKEEMALSSGEILVMAKILLESRALSKEEMDAIIEKLMKYSKREGQENIQKYILNEQYHYTELQNNEARIQPLLEMARAIGAQNKVRIKYIRQDEKVIERTIKPISIMFSEYYFYIVAYLKDEVKPIMYRIDRILAYDILEEHFELSQSSRFEEGEMRKRIQFMYPGELMKVRVKFWGPSLEALLDRLPTAQIVEQTQDFTLIDAEVYGKGIKMWLLSQADKLEVIEPESFRKEMKETILNMAQIYSKQ